MLCKDNIENIYTLCGVDKDGKATLIVNYYSDQDDLEDKELDIDLGKQGNFEIYLLDENYDGELVATTTDLKITLKQNTAVYIKEI